MKAIPYSRRIPPQGPRNDDSERLRNRVAVYYRTMPNTRQYAVWKELALRTGEPASVMQMEAHLLACDWITFVDCVAHFTNGLPYKSEYQSYPQEEWLAFIIAAFEEEHVTFKIDASGSPVPVVDSIFSGLVDSVLDGLNDDVFENARTDVLSALKHFKRPDLFDEAIDSTFKAAENIYKMTSGAIRLDKAAARFYQSSFVDSLPPPERDATRKMVSSFDEWIAAAHFYRHADDQPKPTPPSRETTTWMISNGLAHIRWQAHVYRTLKVGRQV